MIRDIIGDMKEVINFIIKFNHSNLIMFLPFINVFSTQKCFSKGGIDTILRLPSLFSWQIDHYTH